MELSVREAAVLTGRSPRTLRAQLARGEVPGVKRGGRWVVDRRHLPLTDDQRTRLERRAQGVRRQVDAALPSRVATTRSAKERSLADLEAFRLTLELHQGLLEDEALPDRERLTAMTHDTLLALGEAFHEFDRETKQQAVRRARARLAQLVATLLIEHGVPPSAVAVGWLRRLEHEVLPVVAGFARFVDQLGRRK